MKKGQKGTKIDMAKVRKGVENVLGAPSIAQEHGYSVSSVTKALRRLKNPAARKEGSGRRAKCDIQKVDEFIKENQQSSLDEVT